MSSAKKLDLGLQSAYDELFMNEQGRTENRLPKIYDIPFTNSFPRVIVRAEIRVTTRKGTNDR